MWTLIVTTVTCDVLRAPVLYHRPMLQETARGLFCPDGGFFIDPWQPVERAVITHAHGDHARPGSDAYLCTPETVPLLTRRFGGDTNLQSLPYGQKLTLGS